MSLLNDPAPTGEAMLDIATACLERLPGHMQQAAGDIRVIVSDYADDATLRDTNIPDALGLSGLYVGVPLTHESVTHPSVERPLIYLYRVPILLEWAERGDVTITELVEHVFIHELGHHFGWSDEEMHRTLDED